MRALHLPNPDSKRSRRKRLAAQKEQYRAARMDVFLGLQTDCVEFLVGRGMRAAFAREPGGTYKDEAFALERAFAVVDTCGAEFTTRNSARQVLFARIEDIAPFAHGLQAAREASDRMRWHPQGSDATRDVQRRVLDIYESLRRKPPQWVIDYATPKPKRPSERPARGPSAVGAVRR